jgi:hypothetical protein
MSLALMIVINVLADAALIALLAYAMSRPSRLAPHADRARRAEVPSAARARDDQLARAA